MSKDISTACFVASQAQQKTLVQPIVSSFRPPLTRHQRRILEETTGVEFYEVKRKHRCLKTSLKERNSMKLKEYYTYTDFMFSGDLYIDSNFKCYWDNSELDKFLELLEEHRITEYSISQDINEQMQKEIIVKVNADAMTQEFEYDLSTLMLQWKRLDKYSV